MFLEPSYFALYEIPFLCLILFDDYKPIFKKILSAALISVALYLSTSISGIIVATFIWISFIITSASKKVLEKKVDIIKYFSLFAIVIMFLTLLVFRSEYVYSSINIGGSFGQRITRGFILLKHFGLSEWITGVGLNNIDTYMKALNLSTIYDEGNLNYMASLIGILVSSGIIATIFLMKYLVVIYKNQVSSMGKILVICFILIMAYENVLFSYRMGFYVVLIYGVMKRYRNQSEIKL